MANTENKSAPYYLKVTFGVPLRKFELRVFYRIIRVCKLAVIEESEEKRHAIEDSKKPIDGYHFVVHDPIYLEEAARDIRKYVCPTADIFYSNNLDLPIFRDLKIWIEHHKSDSED